MKQNYDIIGDIHGHADALEALLVKLGYHLENGIYSHEKHKVIFLGDFIDRGSQQREVIEMVRPMIEQGSAMAVMGNHEFNAICYASLDSEGRPLREHSEKNINQHKAFLDAFPDLDERQNIINWFKTLPIFIETEGIRVIHACWNTPALSALKPFLDTQNALKNDAYEVSCQEGSVAFEAIETLLKGPGMDLPEGVTFKDSYHHVRRNARIKWWSDKQAEITDRLHLGEQITQEHKLSQITVDESFSYAAEDKPVFVGHYWLNQAIPTPLTENCACVDYSIAKEGKLVAYMWRGERKLQSSNFIWC